MSQFASVSDFSLAQAFTPGIRARRTVQPPSGGLGGGGVGGPAVIAPEKRKPRERGWKQIGSFCDPGVNAWAKEKTKLLPKLRHYQEEWIFDMKDSASDPGRSFRVGRPGSGNS